MAGTVVIKCMTREQATDCITQIKSNLGDARKLLVDLYELEGWSALGYKSWRECVMTEFDEHQSHLYRLLNAGLIERQLSPNGEIGEIKESHLRELGALDDPLLRQATWQAVQDQPKLTAQIVKRAVNAAAEWASEYLVSHGHTSLEGKSLEVAKTAITERMLENRQRQIQHIADSVAGRWDEPIKRAPFTVVRTSETTGRVVLDVAPEVARLFAALIGATDGRVTVAKPKPTEQSADM